MTYRIAMPWIKPPITGNDRGHSRYSRATKVKAEARLAIRAARLPKLAGANLRTVWTVTDERRRDADNLAPTHKAIQDALVAEGVLLDDSWVYVPTVALHIKHDPVMRIWIEIEPLGVRT